MADEQTKENELITKQRKFFEFKTIPEKLHLDFEAAVLKDEDATEAAKNLLNWEFCKKYCINLLPDEWWYHTDMLSMHIVKPKSWEIAIELPTEMKYYKIAEEESLRSLKVGIFKTRGLSAFGLLNYMEHPALIWIHDKIKLLEDIGVNECITDQCTLDILLITALRNIIKNNSDIPPYLKEDYLIINDLLLNLERF